MSMDAQMLGKTTSENASGAVENSNQIRNYRRVVAQIARKPTIITKEQTMYTVETTISDVCKVVSSDRQTIIRCANRQTADRLAQKLNSPCNDERIVALTNRTGVVLQFC